MPLPLASRAPAKINLSLHVLGRRADGYHELESLVAFAGTGDSLALQPGPALALTLSGPTASSAGRRRRQSGAQGGAAARRSVPGLRTGAFHLVKRLPVAAGIGGGSSDAAAALRLLARLNGLPPSRSGHRRGGAPGGGRCARLPGAAGPHDARHRRDGRPRPALAAAFRRSGQSRRAGRHPGRLSGARLAARGNAPAAGRGRLARGILRRSHRVPLPARNDLEPAACRLEPIVAEALRGLTRRRAAGSPACRARARRFSACSRIAPPPRRPPGRSRPGIPDGGSGRRSCVEPPSALPRQCRIRV